MKAITVDPLVAFMAQIMFDMTVEARDDNITVQDYARRVFAALLEFGYADLMPEPSGSWLVMASQMLKELAAAKGFCPAPMNNGASDYPIVGTAFDELGKTAPHVPT